VKVPQKGLHPNMEPPFEATPKPKPTPAAAAAPAAAPAGDEPGKKKKGFLGSLSFRKGKNQKGAAADAEAKAQAAAASAAAAKQAASMPAEAMAGILDGCPLGTVDYAKAWKDMVRHGRRPKISRLYTALEGVLADPPSMQYFVNYLKSINTVAVLKFFIAADRYTKGFAEKSVDERETEAVDIFNKYIASGSVELPAPVAAAIAKAAERKESLAKAATFRPALGHVYELLQTKLFAGYQKSPHYSQYCISVLTSGTVYLEDMLYNESFLMGFIEYMTMEDVGGIIQFWLIADSFNDQLHAVDKKGKPTLDAAHAKGDATGIYKRFIAQNAAEPLGVDARTRAELEKLIAPEAGPDKRSFLRSLHLAHTSLAKHFFPAYMSSDAFYQYLNGLVSAAKVADATPAKQAKGGVAPAGDAAAGDPAAPADEKASVRMLKRTPSQLGLVDGWGVYQRDEDATNPLFNDAHSHGRVSKSRVVGIGKKKNKEHEKDVAVQVARMIITDVYREMNDHETVDKAVLDNLAIPAATDPMADLMSEPQ